MWLLRIAKIVVSNLASGLRDTWVRFIKDYGPCPVCGVGTMKIVECTRFYDFCRCDECDYLALSFDLLDHQIAR